MSQKLRECEDCGDTIPLNEHRTRCAACGALLCGWCIGHVHGLAHSEARKKQKA